MHNVHPNTSPWAFFPPAVFCWEFPTAFYVGSGPNSVQLTPKTIQFTRCASLSCVNYVVPHHVPYRTWPLLRILPLFLIWRHQQCDRTSHIQLECLCDSFHRKVHWFLLQAATVEKVGGSTVAEARLFHCGCSTCNAGTP